MSQQQNGGAGRAAIVTGGGSGIGRAVSLRLAADGFAVAVVDIDSAAAEKVAAEAVAAGGQAIAVGDVDVSNRAAVEAAVAHVREALGPVLVLVNNAGVSYFGPFLKVDDEQWERVQAVNVNGPFYCCQAVLPHMIEAGWGRIVNISSSSAQGGQPYMIPYVTSKAALIGMTKALALEFGPKGVTVNTIPPGFIDTPMLRDSESKGLLGGTVADHEAKTPVRRAGTPEDIAAATSWLVRDESGYVTGQVIGLNGGRNTG
jgi:NAD(P)-dependent dehydrogenase (short-subunit alcohol dehydrogenase family)